MYGCFSDVFGLPYRLASLLIHVYMYTSIDQICVEVFEKTIRRTEMIDHSFERKFYGAWNRLLKISARARPRTVCAQIFKIAVLL